MERVHIPPSAMVLVSDGRRARFLRNRGTSVRPELIMGLSLGDDNPPALEAADWQAEERFAARIADTLYDLEHARRFQVLVVVAPPRMLGELRARLRSEVADTVIAEVAKDLSALPAPELGRMLS